MKYLLSLFFFLSITAEVVAKNNIHRFEGKTAPYTELTGDLDVTAMIYDSGYALVEEFNGQSFSLMDRSWTPDNSTSYIVLFKSGRVMFMGDSVMTILDVMYSDSVALIDASSGISYKIEGTGTKKVLKIQWKNIRIGHGPEGNYFNAQMWIYQENGIIEFRYGPRSSNNASGYTDPVKGIYIGLWHSKYPDLTKVYEKMQVKGTPPNIQVDSAINMNVPNVQGVPDEGTLYRFAPKSAVSGLEDPDIVPDFRIYPNPAATVFVVEIQAHHATLVASLYDTKGICVRKVRVPPAAIEVKINVEGLPSGTYFLKLGSKKKEISQQVLILRR